MKVFRSITAVTVALFMAVYMIFGAILFAVDLSFDEQNVQKVLGSSDALSTVLQSAEVSLHGEEFEDGETDITKLYRQPEAAALFADIFTGTARYILYGEEYTEVNKELVRDYLYAVAKHKENGNLTGEELEDYISVKFDVCTRQFNSYIEGMTDMFLEEDEIVDIMRFFFGDLKFICIAGAVIHMLILILLIKGKLGYYFSAAVFGFSGISMLLLGGVLRSITGSIIPSGYSGVVSEMFSEKFILLGVLLFAFFSVLMAFALIFNIRRHNQKKEA